MMKTKIRKIIWTFLVLYLVTWLPAFAILRHQRSVYRPIVYPVLPGVVLSCDKRPSLAGEWSVYISYVIGVKKLAPVFTWIAEIPRPRAARYRRIRAET